MDIGFRYYEKKYNLPEEVKYCTKCVNANQKACSTKPALFSGKNVEKIYECV